MSSGEAFLNTPLKVNTGAAKEHTIVFNRSPFCIVPFATSGGSDMGKTNEALAPSCTGAKLVEGKVLNGKQTAKELNDWVAGLGV